MASEPALQGLFRSNGSTPLDIQMRPCVGFEMRGDQLCEIGVDAPVILPPPAPLHPEQTLREQILIEQGSRVADADRAVAASAKRERERQRRNDERERSEFAHRQAALSK